jgi:homoserine dehydrogenase
VLAAVAATFAEHDVSIETVRQRPGAPGESGDDEAAGATLVVVTHRAPDAALSATVEALGALDTVREVVSVMRVEGE